MTRKKAARFATNSDVCQVNWNKSLILFKSTAGFVDLLTWFLFGPYNSQHYRDFKSPDLLYDRLFVAPAFASACSNWPNENFLHFLLRWKWTFLFHIRFNLCNTDCSDVPKFQRMKVSDRDRNVSNVRIIIIIIFMNDWLCFDEFLI